MRVKFCRNEKRAYIYLRRKGYSINQLSQYFGRSTSVIYRTLKKANHVLRLVDLRKLPNSARHHFVGCQHKIMNKLLPKWEDFILGEETEPP